VQQSGPLKPDSESRLQCTISIPAQEVASSAQAFARSALASAAIPQFSGTPALEWAGTPSEPGALTEEFAALAGGVPALAH
jgi:hypothetical protein